MILLFWIAESKLQSWTKWLQQIWHNLWIVLCFSKAMVKSESLTSLTKYHPASNGTKWRENIRGCQKLWFHYPKTLIFLIYQCIALCLALLWQTYLDQAHVTKSYLTLIDNNAQMPITTLLHKNMSLKKTFAYFTLSGTFSCVKN